MISTYNKKPVSQSVYCIDISILNSNSQRYVFLCRFVCLSVCHVQDNMFTEKDYLGFAEQKDSDEIGGWQVGLEVVDFAYGAS